MGKDAKALLKAVDGFMGEWLETVRVSQEALKTKEFTGLSDVITLNGFEGGNNFVNQEGYRHLMNAADLLLCEENLQRRVSRSTAIKVISKALSIHIPQAIKKGVFSEHAVIAHAKKALNELVWSDGIYVFPVVFAPKAKKSDFRVGSARVVSKDLFIRENNELFDREKNLQRSGDYNFIGKWEAYTQRYDHFVTVQIEKSEWGMAWKSARETAEFVLNLIRMTFTYPLTKSIKMAGGSIWEETDAYLKISPDGRLGFKSTNGPWGSHLDDGWQEYFDEQLLGFRGIHHGYALLVARGNMPASPITERLQYANQLISECYSEPHDHIRLVRLISALETMSLIGRDEKADSLAYRCGLAGGWSDLTRRMKITEAVIKAYKCRNKIVHGEPVQSAQLQTAFEGLEAFLVYIFHGYYVLFEGIARAVNPTSVRHLKRELDDRIEMFFWNTDLAMSDSF